MDTRRNERRPSQRMALPATDAGQTQEATQALSMRAVPGSLPHLVHTARAAVQRARLVAEMAFATSQQTLPPAERAFATGRMIPPVGSGVPAHPLAWAVAVVGVANWSVARAIELAIASGDAYLDPLVTAANQMARAGQRAVIAAHEPSSFDKRQALVHAAVSACYQIESVLARNDLGVPHRRAAVVDAQPRRMPQSWRTLADQLARHLASPNDAGAAAHQTAAAARDAVQQLTRTYQAGPAHDGLDNALSTSARAAALACTYAGWSVVLMEDEHPPTQ